MAAHDIAAQALEWALDETRKQCLTEDFGVSVTWSPTPVPGPGGVQMIAVWWLLITAANPELGQGPLHHTVVIGDPPKINESIRPVEAQVRAAVTDGLRQLRKLARSKLAGANGHAGVPG